MKKAFELSTLCDVRTCVLIHGPAPPQDGDCSAVESHTWPLNREEIEGIIRAYKTSYFQKPLMKSFDLYGYFSDRMKKIEAERAKFRNDAEDIKCPSWDERLECLSGHQLRLVMEDLGSKSEVAEGMIGFMEGVSAIDFICGSTENQTPNTENSTIEGASATDFIGGPTENQTSNSENSTIDSQWFPFHDGLQTEEALLMMPDHDFSNLLFGTNGVDYTYEHLLSNEMMMENNNMGEFQSAAPLQPILPLSYLQCASDYSQMMNNAFSVVNDHPLDYSDFEYLMSDWS
ncbi:uncharacterized protein LOC111013182 isoform X2 [Momordica charantia]|uniref:Uncharacterized protein LOC111013182 isoform X2 n=1 Tax=Momordica charantia TaxID=3673 RepID=A0A6J1CQB5_MOMCH|nr:uncharacterized protein LOC111013182 isoform X2 [Momordica charantia]